MCRPAAVRLPAAPTSSCNFPPSSGQKQAGGVQRLRAALKSRQNRIPAMPCNAPRASHSLNIAHSKQPLARYLHAKLATAANARPRQHPEIKSQRASRKSVGAGKGQGCWHCRKASQSKGVSASAGQQHCACQPQQLQVATSCKVLGRAKLVGPNGFARCSSQGDMMLLLMLFNAARAGQHKQCKIAPLNQIPSFASLESIRTGKPRGCWRCRTGRQTQNL